MNTKEDKRKKPAVANETNYAPVWYAFTTSG